MAGQCKTKRKKILDQRIDQFCQTSAELISNIHERCSDLASPKKGKRGRKKKKRDDQLLTADADS